MTFNDFQIPLVAVANKIYKYAFREPEGPQLTQGKHLSYSTSCVEEHKSYCVRMYGLSWK